MFVFQDFSQLFDLYGRNESITSNCDVKITFAPNNLQTSDYISRLLGNETIEDDNSAKGLFPKKQNFHHCVARALLTPDECSRLPKNKSIILRNGFAPIMGDKVPYYLVNELVERTRITPAMSERIVSKQARWFEAIGQVEKIPEKTTVLKSTAKRQRVKTEKSKEGQGELFPWILTQNEGGDS